MGIASADTTPPDGVMAPGRRALTVGLVMVVTLVGFEALAITTAMPAVEEELGDIYLYGWAFSAFLLASLIGIAYAGDRADITGPGRPFAIGLGLFTTGLIIGGLAPTMPVLILGRAIQGLGAGAIPAIAYVAIGRAYPEELRARMFALNATAWVLPGLVGPAIAGAVADYLSWRLVFIGLVPVVLLAVLLTVPPMMALGPPAERKARPPAVGWAALLAFGVGLIFAGTTVREPLLAVPLVVAGAAIAIAPARRLLPPGTLRAAPGLPAVVAGMAILNFAFFGSDAFVPLMLTEVRGQTTVMAGIAVTAATLSWTLGTWSVERTVDRVGRRTIIRTGWACLCAGIIVMSSVLLDAVPVAIAFGAWAIAGLGMGLTYPSHSLLALDETRPGEEGAVATAMKIGEFTAAAAGAGVGNALVAAGDAGDWLAGSLAVNLAIMGAGAVLGFLVAHQLRTDAAPAETAVPVAVGD